MESMKIPVIGAEPAGIAVGAEACRRSCSDRRGMTQGKNGMDIRMKKAFDAPAFVMARKSLATPGWFDCRLRDRIPNAINRSP